MKKVPEPAAAGGGGSSKMHNTLVYIRQHWQLYVFFLGPALILTIIFKYIPMGGILIAFQKYNPFKGILGSEWVGFKYFQQFLSSPDFLQYLANTLKLSIFGLLWGFPMPIILALILNELRYKRFKKVSQTILYLPHFLSWAIIGSVALTMFKPTSGLVNIALMKFGWIQEGIPFLNEKWHWAVTYLLIGIWQSMGWGTILYLAAITGISGEQYEAAMIDGANRWQRMIHITLPGIRSTIVTLLIMNLGRVMGSNLERLTSLGNTQVKEFQYQLAVYIFNKGIGNNKFSMATAVGLFQSVIGVALVLISDRIAKKLGEDGLL